DESENVLLGHAAGEAGAGNPGDVDLMLGGDLADQGRGFTAQTLLRGLDAAVPLRGNGGGWGRLGEEGGGCHRCWSGLRRGGDRSPRSSRGPLGCCDGGCG